MIPGNDGTMYSEDVFVLVTPNGRKANQHV